MNMKKTMIAIGVVVLSFFTAVLYAQENAGFDKELSSLRKNVIQVCGKLQSPDAKANKDAIIKGIDEIIAEWDKITKKYSENIPEEYSKDKDWKGYFAEAADNFSLMKARAQEAKFSRAVQFCGLNCALFVKIHKINGMVTIADKMFDLRMNAKLFVSMALAGNQKGMIKMMKRTDEVLEEIHNTPAPANVDKAVYDADIAQLDKIYETLKSVALKGKEKEINEGMKTFLKEFGKIYVKYI
jgi:hypothetical protein